jgi:hypothetical protein
MSITINVTDKSGYEESFSFNNERQYRMLYFDEEGHPRILGSLPWEYIKNPLKDWAKNWANEQDFSEVMAEITERVPEIDLQELPEKMRHTEDELGTGIVSEDKLVKKDRKIALKILGELFKAILVRLKELVSAPVTIWEYAQQEFDKEGIQRILGWLFRR